MGLSASSFCFMVAVAAAVALTSGCGQILTGRTPARDSLRGLSLPQYFCQWARSGSDCKSKEQLLTRRRFSDQCHSQWQIRLMPMTMTVPDDFVFSFFGQSWKLCQAGKSGRFCVAHNHDRMQRLRPPPPPPNPLHFFKPCKLASKPVSFFGS